MSTSVRLPHVNDLYDVTGLEGQFREPRYVRIHSMSVTGKVLFYVGFMEEESKGQLHNASLPTVLVLIEHGLWTLREAS